MLNNFKSRAIFRVAFFFALLLILIPFGFYFFKFAGNGFSENPQDWASLGDYLNVWVSIASLIFLATLTYVLDRQQGADEKARNRPLLIFRVDTSEKVWYLKNVGKGVALDIDISRLEGIDQNENRELWEMPVRLYALMSGEEYRIFWFKAAGKVCATYNGVLDERKLITIVESDTNTFPSVNPINSFQQRQQYIRIENAPRVI